MINLILMAQTLHPDYSFNQALKNDFLKGILTSRARRSLEVEKINSLDQLADYSEKEIMQFQGFGKKTMIKLKQYMKENNRSFNSQIVNKNYE